MQRAGSALQRRYSRTRHFYNPIFVEQLQQRFVFFRRSGKLDDHRVDTDINDLRAENIAQLYNAGPLSVSYTHLDVYKRQGM